MTCPTIECTIKDRAFSLRMDFNALALAEKMTGRSFLDSEIWDKMDVSTITALFWACAVQTDPKVTIGDVRAFGYKYAVDIVNACRAAWRAVNEIPAEEPRPTNGSEPKENASSAQ